MFLDNDGKLTWDEYLAESFGVEPGQEASRYLTDPEDRKLMDEDRKYFKAADNNHDDTLDREEFSAFQNPEHFPEMHQTLIAVTFYIKYFILAFLIMTILTKSTMKFYAFIYDIYLMQTRKY